jgi:ATP-binding cassette, subfamily B, bacterial
MKPTPRDIDERIIVRYTDQPPALPGDVRQRIEAAWGGGPVQLYAYADLDHALRLTGTWLALGPTHMAIARAPSGHEPASPVAGAARALRAAGADASGGPGAFAVHAFPIARASAVHEAPGLSATTLTVLGAPGDPPLAVLRYTHRQRRAFENVQYVLEERIAGRAPAGGDADRAYAAAVAAPIRDTQALVAAREGAVVFRLLGYLRPYRRELTIGMTAATVITAVGIAPPYIAGRLIDGVIRPAQQGSLPVARAQAIAWLAVAAMALVVLVRQLAALVRLRLMAVVGEKVARDLRSQLYEHIQRLSLSFFARKKTGGLITRVSSDTDRLWEFLAFGIVDVSLSLVMLLGLSAVLLSLDWRLGLVMTVPAPIFCWLIYRHGEAMTPLFLRTWRKWSRVTDVLGDTIPGVRVVKAFNQETREIARFVERNDAVTDEANRVHRLWTTFWPLLLLAVHATTVAVWAFAVPRLLGEGAALSTGTFVSFLLYATMFIAPIEVIGQMARTMNRATSSAHRVFEVLDTEPDVRDAAEPVRLEPVRGRVTFENVTFAYDGVRPVLRGVSFDVVPGELVGLVGPSGGGKSTVVNLIARFYDATGGAVRIDDVDVRSLDTGHYRRQLGMVLQDPYLFHATVLDNIRYGLPDAALADVVAAAKSANAHGFIGKLPHGYDTMVGERGQTLSGGERQRVSIARAILHDPRILILDEATSAVDTETEREIQEALDRLIAGRTVFAIAHRLSTLRRASRLFVMADGRLVEAGTHEELLRLPEGRYRRLHEMQLQLR